MVIQSDLQTIHQGRGYVGTIARANPPALLEAVKVGVPTGGDNLQPGWGVFKHSSDDYREPTSDAEELAVVGVISYDYGTPTTQYASTPSGSNSDKGIEFKDDDLIRLCTEGFVYLRAGEALKKFDRLRFDRADNNWQKITTPTSIAAIPQLCVVCYDDMVASDKMFCARVQLTPVR